MRNGLVRTVVSALLSVASAIALTLVAVVPALGATGSADPGNLQMACAGDTIDGLSTGHSYAAVYVPAGATLTLWASGTAQNGPYMAGMGGSQYSLNFNLWNGGTSPTYQNGYLGLANYYGPSPWPATYSFSGNRIGMWQNSASSAQTMGVDLWAVRGIDGAGINWSVSVQITGGSGGGCPASVVNSELFGPNPSMGEQCACVGTTAHAVNSLTGNENFSGLPGMGVKSRGAGIDFEMAYNSQAAATPGPVGNGWSDSYGMSLAAGNFGAETVTQEGGATVTFVSPDGGTTWVAPSQFFATLVKHSDGTWTFTRRGKQIFTFDTTGRLTSIANRNGYKTNLTYGSSGLSTITDDAGHEFDVAWTGTHISSITDVSDPAHHRSLSMGYDSNGNMNSYTDVLGGSWALGYDTTNRLTSVLSPRYVATTNDREFHYDSQGRVDWEQDPSGNRTTLTYNQPVTGATEITDAAGNVRADYYNSLGQRYKVTTGYGTASASTTTFAFNGNGMVTDRTDGSGHDWLTQYTDNANPFSATKTTDPLGRVQTMTYNSAGDLTKLVDAKGVETDRTYDATGNLTAATTGMGTSVASTVTNHYADSAHPGDVTSVTDTRGKTWTYVSAAATGTLTSVTDPVGDTTSYTYNPQGWDLTQVSPRGNAAGANPANYTTSHTYNAAGRPLTVTDALGHTTTNTYDSDGNVATITKPDGSVTARTWNADEQPATVTVGSGTSSARTLTYTYGWDGRVASHGYSTGATYNETWNSLGLLATSTDPNGNEATYSYDGNGNLTGTTVAVGTADARTTTFGYDADNERTSTVTGAGTSSAVTSTAAFDTAAGTAPCTGVAGAVYCNTTTNGNGNTAVSFYDALGEVIQTTRPGGKVTTHGYTGGLQTSVTNPGGVTTTSSYDDAGRLIGTTNGQTADNVSYTYTPDAQRLTMVDHTGATTYTYNNDDQLTQIDEPNGDHVTYGRDTNGRVNSLTYPDGRVVGYGFNPAGDTTSMSDGSGGTTTFGYGPDGSLLTKHLPNGDTITNTVNGADQTTNTALTNSSNANLAALAYTYTATGQVKTETDTQPGAVSGAGGTLTGSQTYTYDPLGRLKSSTDSTGATTNYGFDADGNLATLGATSQSFNSADQLTSATTNGVTTTYSYNTAGDRTQATGAGSTTKSYGYDNADRMSSATAAVSSPESDYHPIGAARILDTQPATRTGTCVGTCATIPAGGTLTFQATGVGGVPSSATSVMLDVTWMLPSGSGPISLYPAGSTPSSGRDLTTLSGGFETTAVITAVSSSGQVTISSSVQTDIVIEVNGYYKAAPSANGATLVTLNGTRLVDTRTGTGPCTPSPCARMSGGTTTTVQITGHGGIPTNGVVGVAYTLTDYNASGTGYTTAWPADQPQSVTANLTYGVGVNSSELAVTPVSAGGQIKIYTSANSDYTIDLAGYYVAAPNGSSTMFVPYAPTSSGSQRVLDTHAGTGTCTPSCATLTDGTPEYVKVTGTAVPADASAVVLSATIATPSATGSLSVWPQGQLGSNNTGPNYLGGLTNTSTVLTSLGNGWIGTELHGANADLTLDVDGYYLAAPITTSYTYNGDNQLTDTTTSSATTNPHYTYDPHTGLAQRINDHTTDYIYGPDGALLETTADTTNAPTTVTSYYLTDPLTSVRAQIAANGAINTAYTYTPWGTGGPAYAGGNTDTTTGLNYLLNRYQDPSTGQFTTVDPLINTTGQAYNYASGDPVDLTDPAGLCDWDPSCLGDALNAVSSFVQHNSTTIVQTAVVAVGVGAASACIIGTLGICTGAVATLAVSSAIGAADGAAYYGVGDGPHSLSGYGLAAGWGGLAGFASAMCATAAAGICATELGRAWTGVGIGTETGLGGYLSSTPACEWSVPGELKALAWGALGGLSFPIIP